MSAARKLRRLQAQKPQVIDQLSRAIRAVEGFKGIEALPELERLIRESHGLVSQLVNDYQGLADEIEIEREVFLRLLVKLSEDDEENIRKVEAMVRTELLQEREGT